MNRAAAADDQAPAGVDALQRRLVEQAVGVDGVPAAGRGVGAEGEADGLREELVARVALPVHVEGDVGELVLGAAPLLRGHGGGPLGPEPAGPVRRVDGDAGGGVPQCLGVVALHPRHLREPGVGGGGPVGGGGGQQQLGLGLLVAGDAHQGVPEDLVRPGLVQRDADPAQDVDGVLVVAVRDVRGGDLAGHLDVAGALDVRGAEVDDQVVVEASTGLQVGRLERGVGQLVLAPLVLGLAVPGLAALPRLVAAGEVQDRGVVRDGQVTREPPLDEVVARVEAHEVAVEDGVEDALVVLVELVVAGAAALVELGAELVAQVLALDDQEPRVELVLPVEELRDGRQPLAQLQEFAQIAEHHHVGVEGDDGVVLPDAEHIEDEVGLADQVVVLVALLVRVVVRVVDALEDDPRVQGADLGYRTGAQVVVEDDEVLAHARVGQREAPEEGQEAGQVVLVDVRREGDAALAGEGRRVGDGRRGQGVRGHRREILRSVTLWARCMTHAFSLVYSCTDVIASFMASGTR